MFEVPSGKRVKRSQLFNSDGEEESTVTDRHTAKEKPPNAHTDDQEDNNDIVPDYGFEYEFISPDQTSVPSSIQQQATSMEPSKSVHKDTETYRFNLFAPSRPSKTTDTESQLPPSNATDNEPAKPQPQPLQISIRSPSPIPEASGPGSLTNSRPLAHYFTSALPSKTLEYLRTTYLASAINAPTLTKLSTLPWPGTYQPWRTLHLPAHRKQTVIVRTTSTKTKSATTTPLLVVEKPRHRARPSKKRRDLARTRALKRQILIDETKTKEEHEREKKNKKNRERKLKRRAKERREKEMMKGGDGGGGGVEGSIGVSVDGSAD